MHETAACHTLNLHLNGAAGTAREINACAARPRRAALCDNHEGPWIIEAFILESKPSA
jgi:hypothetical protein